MKTLKKSLSIFLALIMLMSCCSIMSFAYENKNHLPQIYIEGFESKQIYHENDVNREDPLFFPINAEKMLSNLTQYEKYLNQAIRESDPDLLYKYICLWMEDCFGLAALQPDGYTNKEGVVTEETTLNPYGDNKFVFRHDCRLSPLDIADHLDAYIEMVKAATGKNKFELAASSFGASVAIAYIQKYPQKTKQYFDSIVLCVPSTKGVNFAGELFSGSFDVNPDALLAFIDNMEINDELSLFLSMLNKTGTLDAILDSAVEPILKAALVKALRTVVHDIFGTMPSMWSFVDERYFYDALEYTYGENYADADHEYAGLINKIVTYHESIMLKSENIITDAIDDGIKVSIITKYGEPPIPVSKEGNFTGDGFVALEKASYGATCAMNGKKLPAGYKQAVDTGRDMLSPDGCVDASTGLLPFNTWYIKGLWHGEKTDSYYDLINSVLYDDLTIENDRYPQFLEVDADGLLIPMSKGEAPEKETSWLHDFLALIRRVFSTIIEKVKGMFVK